MVDWQATIQTDTYLNQYPHIPSLYMSVKANLSSCHNKPTFPHGKLLCMIKVMADGHLIVYAEWTLHGAHFGSIFSKYFPIYLLIQGPVVSIAFFKLLSKVITNTLVPEQIEYMFGILFVVLWFGMVWFLKPIGDLVKLMKQMKVLGNIQFINGNT